MRIGARRVACTAVLLLLVAHVTFAQATPPLSNATPGPTPASEAHPGSNAVLERVLAQWPLGRIDTAAHPGEWSYEEGVLLDGMIAEWRVTGDGRLFSYVKAAVDRSVDVTGTIHMDNGEAFPANHSLNNFEMGRSLVLLYRVLQQERYYLPAKALNDALQTQPKNQSGGFWQQESYPDQMWLSGAYMAGPFLAAYARTFNQPEDMTAAADQLLLMDARMRDRQTGLLRYGWDESKKSAWADKRTGLSPEVWSRAMGWYVMALVDVLERMPTTDPQRAALEDVARRQLQNVAHYQDTVTGLWWQVMDKGSVKGNYEEASASCMFVYALAKAIRLDLLPLSYEANVTRGWTGIQSHFVRPDGTLSGTFKSTGVDGTPLHPGVFDDYIGGQVVDNDPKGVAAYLLAHSEILQRERAGDLLRRARGKTVLVDSWFNDQKRRAPDGHEEFFHYKWSDDANSGYSFFARMFQQYGMRTEPLDHAPHAEDLKGVDVYVIVSPDMPAVSRYPHYMEKDSADVIEAWVKAGGVLLLMENDSEHADQTHLDLLSDRFGIHFNPDTRNREAGTDDSPTLVKIPSGAGGIFRHDYTALEKETCTITVSAPAKGILTEGADTMMAVAYPGHGVVYANVDPWLYNEYTDGRKTPLGEQNFAAGQDLVRWVVHQAVTH